MSERSTVVVESQALGQLMERLLHACGSPEDIAACAANVFLEAELRGIGLQGIDYMPKLIRDLRSGRIVPDGRPRVANETVSTALIDGHRGLGQPAAILATDVAVRKAREAGVATVAITRSHDIFMIGYYAERIARSGCVGIVCTSGAPLVHAHGGIDRVLSTNPIAFAIPSDAPDPMVFDMSTSAQSNARIRQAAYHREGVPPGSGLGPDGTPSEDAATIQAGAISPLAGHKGFGLSLCVALLSGPLTGSEFGAALKRTAGGEGTAAQGHLLMAIAPDSFVDPTAFRTAVSAYFAEIKGSRRAPGIDAIRIPGERAFAERSRRLRDGVPVLGATWTIVSGVARELRVDMPGCTVP